jgi:hypothetical protein
MEWHQLVAWGVGFKARAFPLPREPPRSTLNIIWSCGLFEGKGVSTSRVTVRAPAGPHLSQSTCSAHAHLPREPQRQAAAARLCVACGQQRLQRPAACARAPREQARRRRALRRRAC